MAFIPTTHYYSILTLANGSVQVFFLITVLCFFVPFSPVMVPKGGLDPSWAFGLNQAVAQHFAFGKELIFTYGPYASIRTQHYHPSTDTLMMVGGFYLACSYWLASMVLMSKTLWGLLFLTTLTAISSLHVRSDILFFSYPLMVALICFKIIRDHGYTTRHSEILLLFILFSPLGLLPLIKGSMLPLSASIAGLCILFFIKNRRLSLAVVCLITPVISMFLLWFLSGQSVENLPHYLARMMESMSGYAEAMSLDGDPTEVLIFIFVAMSLLWAILAEKNISVSSRLFLSAAFFLFLFISFKGGFLRHDMHAKKAGGAILVAVLLIPFITEWNWKKLASVFFLSVVSWGYIDSHYTKMSAEYLFQGIYSTYFSAWDGLKNRISDKEWPQSHFDAAIEVLRNQSKFPLLEGTTDIYSYHQSYLIASGNSWNPRPVFQSYSAYTPSLLEINKAHLVSDHAPDHIIFRVEPIDGRIPSIEDGASWPLLLNHYRPTKLENDFLFLKKKKFNPEKPVLPVVSTEIHIFSEKVHVPHADMPVLVEMDIRLTWFGQLANIFFKPTPLEIFLELENGMNKTYRLISNMSRSGFLLSPLVENTSEFARLYHETDHLAGKRVKSFSIAPVAGKNRSWKSEYVVNFRLVNLPAP